VVRRWPKLRYAAHTVFICLYTYTPPLLFRFSLSSICTFSFTILCHLFLIVFCLDSCFLSFHFPLLYFYLSIPLSATFLLFPFSLNQFTVFQISSPSTRIVQRRWPWTLYLEFWDQLDITPSHYIPVFSAHRPTISTVHVMSLNTHSLLPTSSNQNPDHSVGPKHDLHYWQTVIAL